MSPMFRPLAAVGSEDTRKGSAHKMSSWTGAPLTVSLCLVTMLMGMFPQRAYSQAKVGTTAASFLTIITSARANGMGGCAANMVSEEAALYNPGALGLFHLEKYLAVTYPFETQWVPDATSSSTVESFNVSAGACLPQAILGAENSPKIAVAAAYARARLDFPQTLPRTTYDDPLGMGVEVIDFHEIADYYSVAVATEYYLRVGFGYSHKRIFERIFDNSVTATVHDYGMVIELPIGNLLRSCPTGGGFIGSPVGFAVTPSLGYVKANLGDDIGYQDSGPAYSPPKISRFGLAMFCAVRVKDSELGSLRITREIERDLVGDRVEYKKIGGEAGLLGIAYLRVGNRNSESSLDDLDTFGFGIRAAGAIAWLKNFHVLHRGNNLLGRMLNTLDLTFDYARYSSDDSPLDDTEFYKLSLSL